MSKAEEGWHEGATHRYFSAGYQPERPDAGVVKGKLPEGVVAFPAKRARDLAAAAAVHAVREQVSRDMDEMLRGAWKGDHIRYNEWMDRMQHGVPSVENQDLYREMWMSEYAARQEVEQTAVS